MELQAADGTAPTIAAHLAKKGMVDEYDELMAYDDFKNFIDKKFIRDDGTWKY